MPSASVTAPATSSGSDPGLRDSIIFVATRTNAMMPSGTLIVKMERHPNVTVRNAPRSGPTRLANPQTPLKKACTRARSSRE